MAGERNFLVPTADSPFVSVDALPGIGLKVLNTIDALAVWSTILRIEEGATLPQRAHSGLCEMLVIKGRGRYASGNAFGGGDYLREQIGDYEAVTADETIELFITHHGICTFVMSDQVPVYVLGQDQIKALLSVRDS